MTIIRTIEGAPTDYAPGEYAESLGGGRITVDPAKNLKVRGPVLTDEGGYRCNFSGTTLFFNMGTCSFTTGSTVVSGAAFDGQNIRVGDYVKLTSDSDDKLCQVESIVDANTILIYDPGYMGSTAIGLGSASKVDMKVGTGTSYSVGLGDMIINSGTVVGGIIEMERDVDYTPLIKQTSITISQRVPNQTILLGVYDDINTPNRYWAWFKFTGTDNTILVCESAFSKDTAPTAIETETSNVKLPSTLYTNMPIRYRIECLVDKVRFLINGILVAEHFKQIPNPYALLTSTLQIINNVGFNSTSTIVNVDYDSVQNFNKVMVSPINDTDPAAATTNDMETLVNLLTQLVSRTPYPDPLGRVRTNNEVTIALPANQSTNIAQFGGQNAVTGLGIGGNGIPRMTLSIDSFSPITGIQTTVGATLPIIYNNIAITA